MQVGVSVWGCEGVHMGVRVWGCEGVYVGVRVWGCECVRECQQPIIVTFVPEVM